MNMAKQDTVESVIAAADKAGAPRQYMGAAPISAENTSGNTGNQQVRPKGNPAASDPAFMPHLNNSTPFVLATENPGASYAIRANIHKPVDPVAGATQANSRIVKSAVNRAEPNFAAGAQG
jgi:hypothetical protein